MKRSDLLLRVTANEAYKDKINIMHKHWSEQLKVSIDQFSKPFYQRVKQKKQYSNSDGYFGVIRIRVRRSINYLRKMRGWLLGLSSLST